MAAVVALAVTTFFLAVAPSGPLQRAGAHATADLPPAVSSADAPPSIDGTRSPEADVTAPTATSDSGKSAAPVPAARAPMKPPSTLQVPATSPIGTRVLTAVRSTVPDADVAVEVYDRQTGTVVASLDPDETFDSMSVVKLLIAVDALHRNDWRLPDRPTQERLSRMLSLSDDRLASQFWVQDGGAAIVERDAALMGLSDTEPPDDPGEWGDTELDARGTVRVYRYILDVLPAADRNLIVDALQDAPRTAADGTDQYFGIPDALPNSSWGIKQGWGSSGSEAFYHTTGLVGPNQRFIVAVLTTAPMSYYRVLPGALTAGVEQLAPVLR